MRQARHITAVCTKAPLHAILFGSLSVRRPTCACRMHAPRLSVALSRMLYGMRQECACTHSGLGVARRANVQALASRPLLDPRVRRSAPMAEPATLSSVVPISTPREPLFL